MFLQGTCTYKLIVLGFAESACLSKEKLTCEHSGPGVTLSPVAAM